MYVPTADTAGQVSDASQALRDQVQRTLAPPSASTPTRTVSA
jgi:hypothetical protein